MSHVAKRLFVSYSRSEFNYADAVVNKLQQTGHAIWFDNQALLPGVDWFQGIQAGLQQCDAVILVASREALRKVETVGKEWQYAIEHNKALYVLVYEELVLPDEIRNHASAIVDGRGDFIESMRNLQQCLSKPMQKTCHAEVPAPNRLGLPRKLPPEVRSIQLGILIPVGYLLVQSFFCGAMAASTPSSVGGLAIASIVGLAIASILVYGLFDLFRNRHKRFEPLRNIVILRRFLIIVHIISFFNLISIYALYRMLATENAQFGGVYRWAGRGGGKRLRTGTQYTSEAEDNTSILYRLFYHPRDAHIAREVRSEMHDYGHLESSDSADCNLLLLSHKTEPATIEQAMAGANRFIPIVTSNLNVSASAIQPILRYQVLDYRRRERYSLRALAYALRYPNQQVTFGAMMEPTAFDRELNRTLWSWLQPWYEATPLPILLEPVRRAPWPYKTGTLALLIAGFISFLGLSGISDGATLGENGLPNPDILATNAAFMQNMPVAGSGNPSGAFSVTEAAPVVQTAIAQPMPTGTLFAFPAPPLQTSPGSGEDVLARIEASSKVRNIYGEDVIIKTNAPVSITFADDRSVDAYLFVLDARHFITLSTLETQHIDDHIQIYTVPPDWQGWVLRVEQDDDPLLVHIIPNQLLSTPETMPANLSEILAVVMENN